jgi:hypothetical protein
MTQGTLFDEHRELDELRRAEQQLQQRQKEFAELPKKIEREKKERDCTMPPLEDIKERERRKRYEESVTRGEIANLQRAQRRSLGLLLLLIAATASLITWGLRLMQG